MPVMIGGEKITSFQSTILLKAFSGSVIPADPSQWANLLFFDQCQSKYQDIKYLDDATHSGLWMHTGVRQTAVSFKMQSRMKWDLRYPMADYINMVSNKWGFQLIWTISNKLQSETNYPADIAQQYYWCPSVFMSIADVVMDVTSKPPRIIEFTATFEANGPSFFIPTDLVNKNVANFLTYIRARGWSF